MNDRKASLVLAFIPTIAMVCALAGFGVGFLMWGAQTEEQARLRAALDMVEDRYVDSKDSSDLVDGAIEGMTRKLDPYLPFLPVDPSGGPVENKKRPPAGRRLRLWG